MKMFTSFVVTILVAVAVAKAQKPDPTCTTTIRAGVICGCGVAAHTATALIDCRGCEIQGIAGVHCDIVCESQSTVPTSTTTIVSCALSTTLVKRQTEDACTTTFTSPAPAFGCTTTVSRSTQTESVDCHGCVPVTVTASTFPRGHGPVCVGGRKTVTVAGTATAVTCATKVADRLPSIDIVKYV